MNTCKWCGKVCGGWNPDTGDYCSRKCMSEAIRENEAAQEREFRRRASMTQEERDAEDAKKEAYQRKIKEMAEKRYGKTEDVVAKMKANKKARQELLNQLKPLLKYFLVGWFILSLVSSFIIFIIKLLNG